MPTITIEDWEDGDLTTLSSEWDGWTGDTGNLSNQTTVVLDGNDTGRLAATQSSTGSDLVKSVSTTRDRAGQIEQITFSYAVDAGGDNFDTEFGVYLYDGSGQFAGALHVKTDVSNSNFNAKWLEGTESETGLGNVIAAGLSYNTRYTATIDIDYSTDSVTVTTNSISHTDTFIRDSIQDIVLKVGVDSTETGTNELYIDNLDATGPALIAAPATTLTATTPEPSVTPEPITISAPATTLTATAPTPSVTAGAVTVTPPATTLTLTTPAPGIGGDTWALNSELLGRNQSERSTHRNLTLDQRITTAILAAAARPAKAGQGRVSVLNQDDGGFASVGRANGANTFTLKPPLDRRPLRKPRTVHVTRYEEDLVSQAVEEWDIELEVVRSADRTDPPSLTSTGGTLGTASGMTLGGANGATLGATSGSGQWGFRTRYGQIDTDRVDAEFLGTGRSGVERFEVLARFTFDQAHVWETALAKVDGVRVREIGDGTNRAVDETAGNDNTITVDSPTPTPVTSGDYIILEWESRRLNEAYQEIRWEMAKAP